VAQSLADAYDVPIEEIMTWFCEGYGFGEIVHALQTSEETDFSPEELLTLKTELGGWGQVWQELGLIGHTAKPDDAYDGPEGDTPANSPRGAKEPAGPKKDKPEPGRPAPKKEKPDNPGRSKNNKP
jgi:hypothetical protein